MAEHFLHELGIGQLRVRDHNGMARIEVLSNDMPVILENANHIVVELKRMGFVYITLDLMGYRCMMSKRSERIFLCLNA